MRHIARHIVWAIPTTIVALLMVIIGAYLGNNTLIVVGGLVYISAMGPYAYLLMRTETEVQADNWVVITLTRNGDIVTSQPDDR